MPGYSGTPLPKKLGIKTGFRALLVNAPEQVRVELREALSGCEVVSERPVSAPGRMLDFAMVFTQSRAELSKKFGQVASKLTPAGMLWVSWPKKSSGVQTDLDENVVRAVGLSEGLVDVKVCAVTEVWSGLKLVIPVKDRK